MILIPIRWFISQGYDGASVMSGCCTGVQTRVPEFAPYAVYIHCYAIVLNLVLVDSVKSVTSASEFFMLLEALYVLVFTSNKLLFAAVLRATWPQPSLYTAGKKLFMT